MGAEEGGRDGVGTCFYIVVTSKMQTGLTLHRREKESRRRPLVVVTYTTNGTGYEYIVLPIYVCM